MAKIIIPPVTNDDEYEHFLARHGVVGPTIDANPPKPRGKKISEWTFKETCCALFALLVIGLLAPWAYLIFSLIVISIYDLVIGH